MNASELKQFLDEKHNSYNNPNFIATDPIQIPHGFSDPKNIEISAYLTAQIAWGNRKMIINNARKLMQLLDNNPYDFIQNATINDINHLPDFKHRTFQLPDLKFTLAALQQFYKTHGSLQQFFEQQFTYNQSIKESLIQFRQQLLQTTYPVRTTKHISDVAANSAAKRLNMFLMWMVRNDGCGVHFGLFKGIPASALFLPLDVHTGTVGRKLGLLTRNANDWKAVEEITAALRTFDASDPVKYDFALFSLGVFEKF